MKNVLLTLMLLAAAYTTNARANSISYSENNTYLSSRSVTFTEGEVFFEVYLNGTFTFTLPNAIGYSYRAQRNRAATQTRSNNSSVYYANHQESNRQNLVLEDSGTLMAIGDLQITYFADGKVKSIGSVVLEYDQDRLSQIGNMYIVYNNQGIVNYTSGSINGQSVSSGIQKVRNSLEMDDTFRIRRNKKIRYNGNGRN